MSTCSFIFDCRRCKEFLMNCIGESVDSEKEPMHNGLHMQPTLGIFGCIRVKNISTDWLHV